MEKHFVVSVCIFSVFQLHYCDCSVSQPTNIVQCNRDNISIPWNYTDAANMISVVWEYIGASNVPQTAMQLAQGSSAMVQPGFNVVHISNGAMMITNVDTTVSGTYRITVTYSSSTPTAESNVAVTVYDRPTGLSSTNTTSGSNITFTCTATSLGGPVPAMLYIVVDGKHLSTATYTVVKDGADVQCCLNGTVVTACLSSPCITVQSKSVQKKNTVERNVKTNAVSTAFEALNVIMGPIGLYLFINMGFCAAGVCSGLNRCEMIFLIVNAVIGIYGVVVAAIALADYTELCKDDGGDADLSTKCNASLGLAIVTLTLVVIDIIITVLYFHFFRKSGKGFQPGWCHRPNLCAPEDSHKNPEGRSEGHVHKKHKEHEETTGKQKHRELPLPPLGAASRHDTGSVGAVSRKDGHFQRSVVPPINSKNPVSSEELPHFPTIDGRKRRLNPIDGM